MDGMEINYYRTRTVNNSMIEPKARAEQQAVEAGGLMFWVS
jgi:hypothetical protein